MVNKDTESFSSHTHNTDHEVDDNAETKSEVKPLRGSNFPERQSRGQNSRQTHGPPSSSGPPSQKNEPLSSSSRPSSRNASPKRQYLNPQRYWPVENIRPEGSYNHQHSNNYQNQNTGNSNHIISTAYPQHSQRRPSHEKRPNHVSETSNSITTFGTDGTTYRQTTSSVLHDGEEVYRKTSADLAKTD